MALSDYLVEFAADVLGVLIGAWLGYLLGLRQQRKIEAEKQEARRIELIGALKDEMAYLSREVTMHPKSPSGRIVELDFSTVYLAMSTYESIVNSGELLLLDPRLIHSLRELNTQVHLHTTLQTVFLSLTEILSPTEFASHAEMCRKALADPEFSTDDRLATLLRVVIGKRELIAREARELTDVLSALTPN
ncbi:MAG TPA: hypothetical protein VEE83_02560 [Thermoplasmata archaeon]|nr:hypothetical protein [Thermoplasmata archaeon]